MMNQWSQDAFYYYCFKTFKTQNFTIKLSNHPLKLIKLNNSLLERYSLFTTSAKPYTCGFAHHKSRAPLLPRPAKGGSIACFSLRALLIGAGLPNLSLSLLSSGGSGWGTLWDVFLRGISAQHFKKQKFNETFSNEHCVIFNNSTKTLKFRQCYFNP